MITASRPTASSSLALIRSARTAIPILEITVLEDMVPLQSLLIRVGLDLTHLATDPCCDHRNRGGTRNKSSTAVAEADVATASMEGKQLVAVVAVHRARPQRCYTVGAESIHPKFGIGICPTRTARPRVLAWDEIGAVIDRATGIFNPCQGIRSPVGDSSELALGPTIVERWAHPRGEGGDRTHGEDRADVLVDVGARIGWVVTRDRGHEVVRSQTESTIHTIGNRVVRGCCRPKRWLGATDVPPIVQYNIGCGWADEGRDDGRDDGRIAGGGPVRLQVVVLVQSVLFDVWQDEDAGAVRDGPRRRIDIEFRYRIASHSIDASGGEELVRAFEIVKRQGDLPEVARTGHPSRCLARGLHRWQQ